MALVLMLLIPKARRIYHIGACQYK